MILNGMILQAEATSLFSLQVLYNDWKPFLTFAGLIPFRKGRHKPSHHCGKMYNNWCALSSYALTWAWCIGLHRGPVWWPKKSLNYTPEIQLGTWKWWFPIGISYSRVPFSGSMLVSGSVSPESTWVGGEWWSESTSTKPEFSDWWNQL